jgi:hypothetical protein
MAIDTLENKEQLSNDGILSHIALRAFLKPHSL